MNQKKLTIDELKFVQNEIASKGKNVKSAYVLATLLGFLGIHRAYLGKPKSGVLKAILSIATILTFAAISNVVQLNINEETYSTILAIGFTLLISSSVIWEIVDLFSISKWVDEFNLNEEMIATEKAIQSRYAQENAIRKDITQELIVEITNEVRASVYEELKKKINLKE